VKRWFFFTFLTSKRKEKKRISHSTFYFVNWSRKRRMDLDYGKSRGVGSSVVLSAKGECCIQWKDFSSLNTLMHSLAQPTDTNKMFRISFDSFQFLLFHFIPNRASERERAMD
jgi:hypothetical protein